MIFRCTKAMTIVLFSLILEFERFYHLSERFWLVFFPQEYFVIFQFIAALNLITKVQFFVYILKKGLCEIPNSNPFCQLKIYPMQWIEYICTNNGLCYHFQSLCWLNWFGTSEFRRNCRQFLGLCCGLGSEFSKHAAFQSEPINKYRSINDFLMRLFNKPTTFSSTSTSILYNGAFYEW